MECAKRKNRRRNEEEECYLYFSRRYERNEQYHHIHQFINAFEEINEINRKLFDISDVDNHFSFLDKKKALLT